MDNLGSMDEGSRWGRGFLAPISLLSSGGVGGGPRAAILMVLVILLRFLIFSEPGAGFGGIGGCSSS